MARRTGPADPCGDPCLTFFQEKRGSRSDGDLASHRACLSLRVYAAAVLGAAQALAQLKPQHVEVHFLVAACENMVSEKSYRPGDVITASNGKTVEVGNTDAEGRLTLADALVYAERHLGVDQIVDIATLTGAIIISLGYSYAGLFSTNECMANKLLNR